MIKVIVGKIPEAGLDIAGETTRDIFQLDPNGAEVRTAGPMRYALHLSEVGSELLLAQGTLTAPFSLRCVACLEHFPFTLERDDYAADFDRPGDGQLDLTERIREDLLLELPPYPHCDRDADDPDRVCPAAGRFEAREADGDAGPSAWDALDELGKPDS